METLHLIVGLGNPGAEYAQTRHNAGFLLVEKLAANWKVDWAVERKFDARIAKAERSGKRVLLCEPQTFMNLSGEAVGALVKFLSAAVEADFGGGGRCGSAARAKSGCGRAAAAAGIMDWSPSSSTWRRASLRGCGSGLAGRAASREITNYVLGKFDSAGNDLLEKVLHRASDQVECWLDDGIEKAMNQFNGVVDSANEKKKQ